MNKIILPILLMVFCTTGIAASPKLTGDGYYCNSKGIFAYQLSQMDFDGQTNSTLTVLYLNDTVAAKSIDLPPMQIIGLYCTDDKVVIQSVNTVLTYALLSTAGTASEPKLITTRKVNNAKAIAPVKVLYWQHTPTHAVDNLMAKAKSHNFELWFTYKAHIALNGRQRVIYHSNMAEIITFDSATSDEKSRQIIYEKTIEEPIINFDIAFD